MVNVLGRALLFPHHVNYHLEHHLYPAVPHYHLPALHRMLHEKGALEAPRCATSARRSASSSAERAPRSGSGGRMSDLILHHYATSPFSEKVRLVLGLKELALALGDRAGDDAQARRRRADRRLPPHAVHADRRRHLLRLAR